MIGRRAAVAAAAALALPLAAGGERAATLRVSLPPFLPPATMLAMFRPLREHLARALHRTVEMYTARDLRTQVQALRSDPLDVALLPPHLARLAVVDWGFAALAGTIESTVALIVVAADSKLATAADLRGHAVAAFDRLAMPAAVARRWLAAQGVEVDRDLRLVPWLSVGNALQALARGDVAAVVLAATQLQLFAEARRELRVLADAGPMPGPVYVARPDLGAARVDALRRALLAFTPDEAQPPSVANTRLVAPAAATDGALDVHLDALRAELAR